MAARPKEDRGYAIRTNAQLENIIAARAVAETVKSALGPRGLDKMLIDPYGNVTVTDTGFVILDKMQIPHPAAGIMTELARAQYHEVGDGTTSVVLLAGELLSKARELIVMKIHPAVIAEGYEEAALEALRRLDQMGLKIEPNDRKTLRKIALTALTGESTLDEAKFLADATADAALRVTDRIHGKYRVDLDLVRVERAIGGVATKLVRGFVLKEEVVHVNMPKRVEKARIALLNFHLRFEKPKVESLVEITKPGQIGAVVGDRAKRYVEIVRRIVESGANVVICQQGIEHMARHYLARAGILAVKRVYEWDMKKLAKSTGARIAANPDELTTKSLGCAELVEERKIGKERYIFVEGCKDPKSVTILVQGAFKESTANTERTIHSALSAVRAVMEKPLVVVDGGALEVEAARGVHQWAKKMSGKKQLAAHKFAEALEVIPSTLAESCGLDPIAALAELRARHERGERSMGINTSTGKIDDMSKLGVLAPLAVKKHIIRSATEASNMILRIDTIVAERRLTPEDIRKRTSKTPSWRPSGLAGVPRMKL